MRVRSTPSYRKVMLVALVLVAAAALPAVAQASPGQDTATASGENFIVDDFAGNTLANPTTWHFATGG